jgi:hypothetical protein
LYDRDILAEDGFRYFQNRRKRELVFLFVYFDEKVIPSSFPLPLLISVKRLPPRFPSLSVVKEVGRCLRKIITQVLHKMDVKFNLKLDPSIPLS